MTSGPLRFAHYALPPNRLGYCGPDDTTGLWDVTTAGPDEAELSHMAKAFDGAYPYLELIAGHNHIDDPLDERVVDAYWIGNGLLDGIDMATFGSSIDDRFRRRAGSSWDAMSSAVVAGGAAHHSFHVLCVYPWVGLLRAGTVAEPLLVIDRCRIRIGRITAIDGDEATVDTRPLRWDGATLRRGAVASETFAWAVEGTSHLDRPAAGDLVTLHWDWICERITAAQAQRLTRWTDRHLAIVNHAAPLILGS